MSNILFISVVSIVYKANTDTFYLNTIMENERIEDPRLKQ